jgi:hypothetical protein
MVLPPQVKRQIPRANECRDHVKNFKDATKAGRCGSVPSMTNLHHHENSLRQDAVSHSSVRHRTEPEHAQA